MKAKLNRFTVFAKWPNGDIEEVDVDASDKKDASAQAKKELDEGYNPGWRVFKVVGPRIGLYC